MGAGVAGESKGIDEVWGWGCALEKAEQRSVRGLKKLLRWAVQNYLGHTRLQVGLGSEQLEMCIVLLRRRRVS